MRMCVDGCVCVRMNVYEYALLCVFKYVGAHNVHVYVRMLHTDVSLYVYVCVGGRGCVHACVYVWCRCA